MKERPILFRGPMVRAILEGRKTQTRRVVKWNNHAGVNLAFSGLSPDHAGGVLWGLYSRDGEMRWQERANARCPYGAPGDRLWVRETWAAHYSGCDRFPSHYRADLPEDPDDALTINHAFGLMRWRPSIFMPRWASRITLEITDVRVQRLRDIGYDGVVAEGCPVPCEDYPDGGGQSWFGPSKWFRDSWDSINARRGFGWSANPWVWAITFARITP